MSRENGYRAILPIKRLSIKRRFLKYFFGFFKLMFLGPLLSLNKMNSCKHLVS